MPCVRRGYAVFEKQLMETVCNYEDVIIIINYSTEECEWCRTLHVFGYKESIRSKNERENRYTKTIDWN